MIKKSFLIGAGAMALATVPAFTVVSCSNGGSKAIKTYEVKSKEEWDKVGEKFNNDFPGKVVRKYEVEIITGSWRSTNGETFGPGSKLTFGESDEEYEPVEYGHWKFTF